MAAAILGLIGDEALSGRCSHSSRRSTALRSTSNERPWFRHHSRLSPHENSARLHVDYTARELTVRRATRLTVLDARGGWLYVAAPDGATGWVPASHVRRDDTATSRVTRVVGRGRRAPQPIRLRRPCWSGSAL